MKQVVIIGGGPAGLAAAYEFYKQKKTKDFCITVVEASDQLGGISKTLTFKNHKFDLGGHRFYTKYPEIDQFYSHFLGKDMLKRQRLSRIYYQKKFFDYPLSLPNALGNLGFFTSLHIGWSWLYRQLFPYKEESTFNTWVANRFGDKLFSLFFKSYTEKVWGIPTESLSADWAAQRIQNFNLFKAVLNSIFKKDFGAKTVISEFYYPKEGPGMLYKKIGAILRRNNVNFKMNSKVVDIITVKASSKSKKPKVTHVVTDTGEKIKVDFLISTMPFPVLARSLTAKKSLLKSLKKLKFRHFITANFIVKNNPFPDQWIYIHEPDVTVGRVQNFYNWSPHMRPKNAKTIPIALEYFADSDDKVWKLDEENFLSLAKEEIEKLGLVSKQQIVDGFSHKVWNAYPIYDSGYDSIVKAARELVASYDNVYPCGRGGLFRYNNQDHSILTGFYTARNIINNTTFDVWSVNESEDYLEQK